MGAYLRELRFSEYTGCSRGIFKDADKYQKALLKSFVDEVLFVGFENKITKIA